MCEQMCRLCLSKVNLTPIFVDVNQKQKYSDVLALTTGLKITLNDGLPQQICDDCTILVNSALKLRNQSSKTEKVLLLKHGRVTENIEDNSKSLDNIEDISNNYTELKEDGSNIDGFKIDVEFDRITGQDGDGEMEAQVEQEHEFMESKRETKKMTVKEKRALYMQYVDGTFDPRGPIKCKTCKQVLSKWACFIIHVKKHLGSKYICEYCGKSLITSHQFKRHCRSYHGLEKEDKCKHCGYLALDSVQLLMHERRQHTGERPYVCDICAAAYFNRKCLLQHLENHRTNVTVQCDSCPQQFKSRRHLAKHRYSAHGDKGRKRRRERRLINCTIDKLNT